MELLSIGKIKKNQRYVNEIRQKDGVGSASLYDINMLLLGSYMSALSNSHPDLKQAESFNKRSVQYSKLLSALSSIMNENWSAPSSSSIDQNSLSKPTQHLNSIKLLTLDLLKEQDRIVTE